ncbi:MAG: protein translocase subunit SecF [Acidaminobacteraceae bacterium]
MNIAGKYKMWFTISLVIFLIGAGVIFTKGFNLGIDFTGGTMMQIEIGNTISVEEAKEVIAEFNLNPEILHAGVEKTEIIIKTKESLNNAERMTVMNKVIETYNLDSKTAIRAADQFGPTIGSEIRNKAMISILVAAISMLVYITFRFEFVFGISAIIALLHDVLFLLTIYAVFRIPVNSSFIAAVLTIVGYSINDTIVVFDRVRENVKVTKVKSYFDVADLSLKQTIIRSINTSLTTALVIGSLYFLGVEAIKEFAMPLLAGILVGTYSSIFIASPVWALIKTNLKVKNA